MAAAAPRMRAIGLEARSEAAFWLCWGGEPPSVGVGEPVEAVGVLEETMVELEPEEEVGAPETEEDAAEVVVVRVEDPLEVVEAELLAEEEEGLEVLLALEELEMAE
jgi:hypothetical protein